MRVRTPISHEHGHWEATSLCPNPLWDRKALHNRYATTEYVTITFNSITTNVTTIIYNSRSIMPNSCSMHQVKQNTVYIPLDNAIDSTRSQHILGKMTSIINWSYRKLKYISVLFNQYSNTSIGIHYDVGMYPCPMINSGCLS